MITRIPSRPFLQLEILELGFKSSDKAEQISLGHFINICPNLKSLYLRLEQHQLYDLDPPNITMLMEDVVLEYDVSRVDSSVFISSEQNSKTSVPQENHIPDDPIPPLLESFPNLKNLALRRNSGLTDYEIRQILSTWTQLDVLDVRGCRNVTGYAETIVDKFAQSVKRDIQFFWGEYSLSRPTPREAHVCMGFNFMAHVFHRQFSQLPSFLDDEEEKNYVEIGGQQAEL